MRMVTLLAFVVNVETQSIKCDHTEAQLDKLSENAVAELEADGYTVSEGQFRVFNSSAFGANPGNPYILYFHPGAVRSRLPVFSLGAQSAVLWVGCTPTSSAYFSWRSYAFSQGPHVVFASLGDSLNNDVINTSSLNHSDPGGHTAAVITTADHRSLLQIQSALEIAGLPRSAHNLDAVPSSLLNMRETSFMMLHRASVWSDPAEKNAYFEQTRRVFFIEAPHKAKPDPLATQPLRKRGTGVTEQSMAHVTEGIAALTAGIKSAMAKDGFEFESSTEVYDLGLDGFTCLQRDTNCKGDNHDTHYLVYKDSQLSQNDRYVLVGPNSVLTKKCTYTNFGIYEVEHGLLLNRTKSTNLTADNVHFEGSAKQFGVDSDAVFAYGVSRDCGKNKYCLEVDSLQVQEDKFWALAYRTVLEPTTATGNLLSELVLPRVLKFSFNTTT